MAGDVEARLGEDGEHGDVLGHDFGDEAFDSGLSRQLGQLLEEPCSDPLALKIITHGERDLGRMWVSQSIPAGERDDALLSIRPNRADERSALTPVGIEKRCREAGTGRTSAVKAEVAAALGEVCEEPSQAGGIFDSGRAQSERLAVSEDDVTNDGGANHRPRLSHGAWIPATSVGVFVRTGGRGRRGCELRRARGILKREEVCDDHRYTRADAGSSGEKAHFGLSGVRDTWASLAIGVIWLSVMFEAVYGPAIETRGVAGDSSSVPIAVVGTVFAFFATWVLARRAFGRDVADS